MTDMSIDTTWCEMADPIETMCWLPAVKVVSGSNCREGVSKQCGMELGTHGSPVLPHRWLRHK